MMHPLLQILIGGLLIVGVIFLLGGSIGLIRFPDAYCRMHALSMNATLGVICIMWSCFIYLWATGVAFSTKTLLAIAFLMMTVPVGSHMIAKAAYHYGVTLSDKSVRDDLAPEHTSVSNKDAEI